MDTQQLNVWFPHEQRRILGERLHKQLGLTRTRSECFLRLWVYLLIKQDNNSQSHLQPPFQQLKLPQGPVPCTQREAAALFYSDRTRGSERSAGMMLDKLADLRLIKKVFNGKTITIEIEPLFNYY